MNKLKILGISGSLRRDSYNSIILKEAAKLMPQDAELEIISLENLPMYNQDLEYTAIPAVDEFKSKIKAADAILFSSPEYNYSVPGVLKNAIDIASRPWGDNDWAEKPVAIIGATMGNLGTSRMQYHFRQIMNGVNALTLSRPELMISSAQEKIINNELSDEHTKEKISELLVALVDWAKKIK